ncbi:MAG: sulfite oxidase, partial [Sulfuricaulis sp.]|nr:sulfite oxidase [Sulfuricaulis sp.]
MTDQRTYRLCGTVSQQQEARTALLSPGGMIMREEEPLNLEMPFGSLDGFLTPVDRFFVRSHFSIPQIDVKTWRLKIEGEVQTPFELTYDEVREMQSHTIPVTMECAGNGRAFLTPQASGVQWERGAVSNAEWTGVRLTDVLRRAGLKYSVREVIFEGADRGEIKEPPGPAGKIHYARSMPLKKANKDVLLAFKMNGEELMPAHGSPLRVIVPGWYGMASVKWLTRIIASAQSFNGYYQTIDYAFWERGPSAPTLVPITEMQVKAQIARPGFADTMHAGQMYLVRGAAWTTEAEITKVEISTDGGETWHDTHLLGKSIRNAWRLWEYHWRVPAKAGKATLLARATDSEGRTQPTERDEDRRSYIVNHLLPIEVDVR